MTSSFLSTLLFAMVGMLLDAPIASAKLSAAPAPRASLAAAVESVSAWGVQDGVEARERALAMLTDSPLEPHQQELLALAFSAASAMPLDPHVKNRSRAQDTVVSACLRLGQARQAFGYAGQIVNWRRGTCLVGVAEHCAVIGETSAAEYFLGQAADVATGLKRDPLELEWRWQRIEAGIAEVRAKLAAGVDVGDPEARFAARVEALSAGLGSGDFDLIRATMALCATLYDREYGNAERRLALERLVDGTIADGKLPAALRIGLQLDVGDVARRHGDRARGLSLVERAAEMLESSAWLPADRIPLAARIAALRGRLGRAEQARSDLESALAMFDDSRDEILSVDLAKVLRSVAEACCDIADRERAAETYRRVVEVASENPNARVRAIDLSETCLSMAERGFAPDERLRARLLEIREGLRAPW
ncbi:MAG: hypothetical protein IPM29_25970 [Planctomycetes bacterium]|nr:hypothetical protein [Planctomycetota bacterium]